MSLPSPTRNLFLLAQGQFVTTLGTRVFDVAMILWIMQATGSAALMGFAMLFSSLPATILAPIGGALADRIGRLRIIIGADLVGALVIGLVLVAFLVFPDPAIMIPVLFGANVVLGVSGAAFGPAVDALIPTLAGTTRLERANAVFRFSQTGGGAIGQGLGGILFGAIGFAGTIAVNAVSFALSALSESWIRLPKAEPSPAGTSHDDAPPAQAGGLQFATLWSNTMRTTRALLQVRRTRVLLLMIAAFHLCFAALPIALPYYVERVLGLDASWYGVFMAVFSVGILLGFIVSGILKPATDRLRRAATFAFAVALAFGLLAALDSFVAAGLALVLIGAGIGVIIVTLMTELQTVTPEAERGAAMGAAQAVSGSSVPVGMALTGLALDAVLRLEIAPDMPVRLIIAAAASIATIAALTGLWGMRRSC